MKILLMGNSHIGALAQAIEIAGMPQAIEAEFLTARGRALAQSLAFDGWTLRLKGGASGSLVKMPEALTEEGTLDLRAYDLILLYGCQLLSSGGGEDWVGLVQNSGRGYTSALWEALAEDHVRHSDHFQIISSIDNHSLRERFVSLPCPLPSITKPQFAAVSHVSQEKIQRLFATAEQAFLALGVRYRHLPAALLDGGGYATSAAFKSQRPDDFAHINSAGGELVRRLIVQIAEQHRRDSIDDTAAR